jgi:putative ABC transport system permease protein
MRVLIQDLLFALRQMGRRPGFTAVVVLTMALGIGANAAIFSVLDAILLRPLPYSQPEQLIKVWSRFTGIGLPNDQNWVSAPEFRDLQQLNRSFSDLAAIGSGSFNLGVKGSPQRVVGASVSPSLFNMLGAQATAWPHLSGRRGTTRPRSRSGAQLRALARVFGANPNVVGSTIDIDGVPMSVVGVMPAGFAYPDETEIWGPLAFSPDDLSENSRGSHGLEVLGRIKPGLSLSPGAVGHGSCGQDHDRTASVLPLRKIRVRNHPASASRRDRGRREDVLDGADGSRGAGVAHRLRQHCQPVAGAID